MGISYTKVQNGILVAVDFSKCVALLLDVKNLGCGVPKRSVLGPILSLLYTATTRRHHWRHGIDFHADDSHLYLIFESTTQETSRALVHLKMCVKDW